MPLSQVVEFESTFGPILVEIDQPATGSAPAGLGDRALRKATISMEDALETIRVTAMSVNAKLTQLERWPSEVTVSFGVKLAAGLAALAAASAEATMTVTMTWTMADGCDSCSDSSHPSD